jgi:phosphonate transport system permease protein
MSMSANQPRRQWLFDTAIYAYTLLILSYTILFLSRLVGPFTIPELDQEWFLANMNIVSKVVLAEIAIAAALSFAALKFSWHTIGAKLFRSQVSPWQPEIDTSKAWTWANVHLGFIFLSSVLISLKITQASLFELVDREGLAGAFRMWNGLAHPNLNLLSKAILEAISTIYIAFLATIIAIPVAFTLAFFCAKNLMNTPVTRAFYLLVRLFANTTRSVEPLIWALIFTVWVGVGPFAGMLALMVHSVASLAKYYSEIIENVSEGPLDAVRSTGANKIQLVWYAVVPQIILPYIAMTLYLWDTNVRMATVIGLVGGGGIGTLLIQYQGQAMWPEVGCIILVIAVIVWIMDLASAYIREALK